MMSRPEWEVDRKKAVAAPRWRDVGSSAGLVRLPDQQPGQLGGTPPTAGGPGSILTAGDVLGGLSLPGGVLLGGGATWLAVASVTQFLIFTTVVVNWPLLMLGLAAAALLIVFGGHKMADLHRKLSERFESNLLPRLREALVGAGAVHEGNPVPSLRAQLQTAIRQAAAQARQALDAQGAAP